MSLIVKDLWSFFSPPIFFLLWTGLFLFIANIIYTSVWIFQLITRYSKNKLINRINSNLFLLVLLFSFGVELIPCFLTGGRTLSTGQRIKSPYAEFTKTEPDRNTIVGEYILADVSKIELNIHDSISAKTIIRFNSDSTFDFEYFPYHEFGASLSNYKIVNAYGKWQIYEDQGTWVIPINFDTIIDIRTRILDTNGFINSNGFHINKDTTPHEIYIMVGDPDSWEGITLQKKSK